MLSAPLVILEVGSVKWADFCITRVKYASDRTAIVEVEARRDLGDSLGTAERVSRTTVISAILDRGTKFVTAPIKNDKYVRGATVNVVEIRGEQYLRTNRDAIRADNLGELPEYR